MSNGGGIIIVCGTGGGDTGDKVITVFDGPMSVAIKIDKDALIQQLVTLKGDSQRVAERKINQFVLMVERDYWNWGEQLEDLGLDYHRHEPHSQP
jgi:hypothetical protein